MPLCLQQYPAEVAQYLTQVDVETGRSGAVDHAVVPGQAQGQHQTGLEGFAVPHGLDRGAADAQNGNLRRVDDGREVTPANATQ